jgi:hypothetical protein
MQCRICLYVTVFAVIIFPKAVTTGSRTLPQANVHDACMMTRYDEAEMNDEDDANLGKRLASASTRWLASTTTTTPTQSVSKPCTTDQTPCSKK